MKYKKLKSLKLDVTGGLLSNFRRFKFSEPVKSDLFYSLKKDIKNRRFKNKQAVFKLKTLLNTVDLNRINPKRDLDFNSTNSKNVFLRTKRKSSYGQTLMEKQKMRRFLPSYSGKKMKDSFHHSLSQKGDLIDSLNSSEYLFSSANIFVSRGQIKKDLVYKNALFKEPVFSVYSFDFFQEYGLNFLKLGYKKNQGTKHAIDQVFDRVLPNTIMCDLRLYKIKFVGDSLGRPLPYDFNPKKIVQHYRLKRE